MENTIQIDAKVAFETAIAKGALSLNQDDADYAGNYMYMYTDEYGDYFKHIDTRDYLVIK